LLNGGPQNTPQEKEVLISISHQGNTRLSMDTMMERPAQNLVFANKRRTLFLNSAFCIGMLRNIAGSFPISDLCREEETG